MSKNASRIHLESFNYAIGDGLKHAIENIEPVEFSYKENCVSVSIKDASVCRTELPQKKTYKVFPLYPSECRQRNETYTGQLLLTLLWKLNGSIVGETKRKISIPLMLKSEVCVLNGLNSKELCDLKEDEKDPGGYFIVRGKERIFRLFLVGRRNYPFAVEKESWKKQIDVGESTEFGIRIRCVHQDGTSANVVLRYLTDGFVYVMFQHEGYYRYVPLMLLAKALIDETDLFIFKSFYSGDDLFYKECLHKMLRNLQGEYDIYQHDQAKVLFGILSSYKITKSSEEAKERARRVCDFCLRKKIIIHLEDNLDKFYLLCYMTKKLFHFVRGKCSSEDTLNIMNQEVLLTGHLYLMLLKCDMEGFLGSAGRIARKRLTAGHNLNQYVMTYSTNHAIWESTVAKALATGNIPGKKLGFPTLTTGASLLCTRVNHLRFLSYFSCIAKLPSFSYGSTAGYAFQPEAYGFLCPVHTPDGEKTSLINYLAESALITTAPSSIDIKLDLFKLGMQPLFSELLCGGDNVYVILDGNVVGFLPFRRAENFLLALKFKRYNNQVANGTEVVFLTERVCPLYSGIFIFTTPGRLVRPVKSFNSEVLMGTFEQAFSHISRSHKRSRNVTLYEEIENYYILSDLACSIPFVEFNQAPKNIFSCQMSKQAVGIASYTTQHRSDTTMYGLTYPQKPLLLPPVHLSNEVDEYPYGANAVIAVVSYSGYDMEDAVVLNKSSVERGFLSCHVLKCDVINLQDIAEEQGLNFGKKARTLQFERALKENFPDIESKLDRDGLPYVGQKLQYMDLYYSYKEIITGEYHVEYYKAQEEAFVQSVKLLGNHESPLYLFAVSIQLRIVRPPVMGDKFANRHGQKGVCGLLMAAEDLPFSESGITPDVLFNPHGFPSRMTIGMMIEMMAGIAQSYIAKRLSVKPFHYVDKKETAVNFFKKKLLEVGYSYQGTETFMSGVSGQVLEAELFCGVVYYERLRHMVADKYQVRSEGKVDLLTLQPVKGDPRDGAIRFGEMERDALIAHGAAQLLNDRFLESNSDKCEVSLCKKCWNMVYPIFQSHSTSMCKMCDEKSMMKTTVSWTLVVLIVELFSVNIRTRLKLNK